MPNDDEHVPLPSCTLPGTIKVMPAALELAKQFQASIPAGWIVVFRWYDGRRERTSKDAPWVDKGPGLGLGTFEIGDIPEEAVYQAGSFHYAVLIRKEIVDNHPERTIDLIGPREVILR